MLLVTAGEGVFCMGKGHLTYSSGTLVFAFENETLCAEPTKDTAFIYIDFNGTRAAELLRRFAVTPANRVFSGFDGLIPLWNESIASASPENIDLAAESILLYTFSRLSVKNVQQNDLVSRIVEISEEQFSDPELNITAIAQALSYNPKYLSHLFKQKVGVTYSEYLRTLRIRYSVALFDRGIDSVKNVAILSGFSDPLYFSTVFKKYIGMSPKEYKQDVRAEG